MSGSIFLGNIHHAYAQADGTYAFPNSREGDMLKQAVRELAAMRKERDEAMALIENIANEVNVLSTRPAAIIKFSDLVDQINEWGDAARKILDKKESADG